MKIMPKYIIFTLITLSFLSWQIAAQNFQKNVNVDFGSYLLSSESVAQIKDFHTALSDKDHIESADRPLDIYQSRSQAWKSAFRKGVVMISNKLMGVYFDDENTVSEYLDRHPDQQIYFQDVLSNIQIRKQKVSHDLITLHLELILTDYKQSIFQANEKPKANLFNLYLRSHLSLVNTVASVDKFPEFKSLSKTAYSGLIVDLRSLSGERSLFPKIYDESGLILYQASLVDPMYVSYHGLVKYAHTVKDAYQSRRVGINPYYVVPIAMIGKKYKTDPVILRRHSELLFSHPDSRKALKEARVIFIID